MDFSWIDFDLEGARGELLAATDRVVSLVESLAAPTAKSGTLEWSRAETAAHLIAGCEGYTTWLNGNAITLLDRSNIAQSQIERIAEIEERDPRALATRLRAAADALVFALAGRDAYEIVPYNDKTQPVGAAAGLMIGELLLHGADMAAGTGVRWEISQAACRHIVRGNFAVLPYYIRRDVAASRPCEFDIRVADVARARWSFGDHGLRITAADKGRYDVHVAARAKGLVLALYGRRSPISQVARGQVIAYGRKPFAPFRLRDYAMDI